MIKLIRVDHRLLHGQVAFNWVAHLNADSILLVSDNLLDDPIRLSAVKLAKPADVKLVVMNVDKAIDNIKRGVTDKYNLLIVCETVEEAVKLSTAIKAKELNLGGTLPGSGKTKLERTLYLDDLELELLKTLEDNDVNVYYQMIPSEVAKRLKSLI